MKETWNKKEVNALFTGVEKCKAENKGLLLAFEQHAKKYGRKRDSVRNFYYAARSEFSTNPLYAAKYAVDMKAHALSEQRHFSSSDAITLFESIEQQRKKGLSVRKICLKLANNDIREMVRLQNKYRSTLAKKVILEKPAPSPASLKNNILTMPQRFKLGDSEINSLFMGLVKLVKKSAMEEAAAVNRERQKEVQQSLQELSLQFSKTEEEKRRLEERFSLAVQEKEQVLEELKLVRSQFAGLLSEMENTEKMDKLKEKLSALGTVNTLLQQ